MKKINTHNWNGSKPTFFQNRIGSDFSASYFKLTIAIALLVLLSILAAAAGINVEDGKLGIGAASDAILHVNQSGSARSDGTFQFFQSELASGNDNSIAWGKAGVEGQAGLAWYQYQSSGESLMGFNHWGDTNSIVIAKKGNVGIGTNSSTERLLVNGNLKVGNASSTGTVHLQLLGHHDSGGGSGFRLQFDRSNEIFGISREYGGFQAPDLVMSRSSGYVGMGITSPQVVLHVNSGSDTNIMRLQDSDGTCDHNPEAGAETVSCSSDERLKANIRDSGSALDYLGKFRIRNYEVRSSGDTLTGVVAQEVMQTNPEMVSESNGTYYVQMPNVWKLVKAIQELDTENALLKNELCAKDPSFSWC